MSEQIPCTRPYCLSPATAFIPLPAGSRYGDLAVCAQHEREARDACYFVVSIAEGPREAEFEARTWRKHEALRGGRILKYVR